LVCQFSSRVANLDCGDLGLRLYCDEPSFRGALSHDWIDKHNDCAGTAHPGSFLKINFAHGRRADVVYF